MFCFILFWKVLGGRTRQIRNKSSLNSIFKTHHPENLRHILCYLHNLNTPTFLKLYFITNKKKLSHFLISNFCFFPTVNKQSIPLVPFNDEQNKILVYQPFVLLLHKLGFQLPADATKFFVRIPEYWTADILFNVAEKLGAISNGENIKFYCLKL